MGLLSVGSCNREVSQNAACFDDQLWGNSVATFGCCGVEFIGFFRSGSYPALSKEFVFNGRPSQDGEVLSPVRACNCWTGDEDHDPAFAITDASASLLLLLRFWALPKSGRKNPLCNMGDEDVMEFTWEICGTCGTSYKDCKSGTS